MRRWRRPRPKPSCHATRSALCCPALRHARCPPSVRFPEQRWPTAALLALRPCWLPCRTSDRHWRACGSVCRPAAPGTAGATLPAACARCRGYAASCRMCCCEALARTLAAGRTDGRLGGDDSAVCHSGRVLLVESIDHTLRFTYAHKAHARCLPHAATSPVRRNPLRTKLPRPRAVRHGLARPRALWPLACQSTSELARGGGAAQRCWRLVRCGCFGR